MREAPGAISSLELSGKRGEESARGGLRYPSPRGANVDRVSQSHRAENHRMSTQQIVRKCGRYSKDPMDGRMADQDVFKTAGWHHNFQLTSFAISPHW